MIVFSELKKLAERATPGPWVYDSGNGQVETKNWRIIICERYTDLERRYDANGMYPGGLPEEVEKLLTHRNDDDLDFMGAANPETVIKMIDLIDTYEYALKYISHMGPDMAETEASLKAKEALIEGSKINGFSWVL